MVAEELISVVEAGWRVFVPALRSVHFGSTIMDETVYRRSREMYYLSY